MSSHTNTKQDLERQVLAAAADNGMSAVLFRNAVSRRLGLNITDSECMSLLSIKGISSPTELARYTNLTTGSTTAMLDRLEKANFIKRLPNPNDRRGTLIQPNPESAKKTMPLVADVQSTHKALIASYSESELEVIVDFMTRFTKNIKNQTKIIEKDLV